METGTKPPEARAENIPAAIYDLALVIPTYREAGNLRELLDRVRAVLDAAPVRYQILVVDDDSRDGTAAIVAAIAGRDPRVSLLVRRGERGLSGAILDGWSHSDAEILGVMDADLQHPPELLVALLAAIREGNDLAIGSRYAAGGQLGKWSPLRHLLSAAAVALTRPIQRPGSFARDPMSGFFLVRSCCVRGIGFQRAGFKLLLDILVRGRVDSVKEVPFVFGSRFCGTSKAGLRVACDYLRLLARLYAWRYCSSDLRALSERAATSYLTQF